MSFSYTVERINSSFEQIAQWYKSFVHSCEIAFLSLHRRIVYLEDRQAWQGPSDEQVERVLRKILRERFTDAGVQRVENPNELRDGDRFIELRDTSVPRPFPIDPATLRVDKDSVPSEKYRETMEKLEGTKPNFPPYASNDDLMDGDDDQMEAEFKRPRIPSNSRVNNGTL